MEPGVFFGGLVFVAIAVGAVVFLRRLQPKADLDEIASKSRDVGWAAGYQPKPLAQIPSELEDLPVEPRSTEPIEEHLLDDYLFDPDELRALGRDRARRRLSTLHLPAPQLEEVLDALFGE